MRTKRLPKRLKWFKKFLFTKLDKNQQLRQEKFQQEFKNILQSCKNPPVVPFSLQLFTSEIYHLFSLLQPLHLTPRTSLSSVLLLSSPGRPGRSNLTPFVTFKAGLGDPGESGECVCVFIWGRRGLEINADFSCHLAVEFLHRTLGIVKQGGSTDGHSGEDKVVNLCWMKKVLTADRGRENVFIHP